MPLKHRTETMFIVLLTVVILATGVLLASLPPLPTGSIPWVILFVITLLYASLLMPFFRIERADHEFRSLHWFPMTMTLLWLGFALLAWFVPSTTIALEAYTWAWLLPMVTFAMIGLLLFCSKVIRQLAKRTVAVLVLFIPFAALALWSSTGPHFERFIASTLWEGGAQTAGSIVANLPNVADDTLNNINEIVDDTVTIIDLNDSQSSSDATIEMQQSVASASSLGESEQEWQVFLEGYQASSASTSVVQEEVAVESSASSVKTKKDGMFGFLGFDDVGDNEPKEPMFADDTTTNELTDKPVEDMIADMQDITDKAPLLIGQNSSVPSHLPNSGFSWTFIIMSMIALYSAVLHKRQVQVA